jgi:hypothetical protein
LQIAWNEGFAKPEDHAVDFLGAQLGGPGPVGKTILPGVYREGAALNFAAGTVATFDAQGDANAVFIIKVGSTLTDSGILANKTEIKLAGGAQARNIWFVVQAAANIGSGTIWYGNILAGGTLSILDGSTVTGRLLGGAAGAGAVSFSGGAAPGTTVTVP